MQYILIFNAHNGTLQIMWDLSSTEDSTDSLGLPITKCLQDFCHQLGHF